MELRHLRYFLVVAEELNFTRAAARLNMQQPPLSHQIRLLENELGFDLFRRHPKGADLTAGGHAFVAEATAILANLSQATMRARRVADGMEGRLAVGLTTSVAAHHLTPSLIRACQEKYAGVTFDLTHGSAAVLTDLVAASKVDVALLRLPAQQPPGLEAIHLLDEEMLLVLPTAHPALGGRVQAGMSLPLVSLAHEKFIMLRRPGAPEMYAGFLFACDALGFVPIVERKTDHMLTIISMVAAGAGVSIVPASMRGFHAESVAYCPIAGLATPLTLPIHALYQPAKLTPLGHNFLALAQRLAATPA